MFNICYLDDFVYSKVSQNIYSTFYVEVNDTAFPEKRWTDFPFAVIKMWCENLISNVLGVDNSKFQLFFMDGPFVIDCKKNQDEIKMYFVNNRKGKVIENEGVISSSELVSSIYKASKRLIMLANQRNYGNIRDVKELELLIKKLKL